MSGSDERITEIPHGSCLVCGYDKPYAVWHYSDIAGVCEECRAAPALVRSLREEADAEEKQPNAWQRKRNMDVAEYQRKLDAAEARAAHAEQALREARAAVYELAIESNDKARGAGAVRAQAAIDAALSAGEETRT